MIDDLTDDELAFLARYRLTSDDLYDARRLPSDYWKRAAKQENKTLVLGTRCAAYGHRLRTRAGHCVQCDPKKLAFQERYSADLYVYIAGSIGAELVKIGSCTDIFQREHQMRAERYGGARDWKMLFYVRVRRGGELEDRARARLARYVVVRPYWKDGEIKDAIELLQCPFSEALSALGAVMGDSKIGSSWKSRFTDRYEFVCVDEKACS